MKRALLIAAALLSLAGCTGHAGADAALHVGSSIAFWSLVL